jgi:ribosomal protein S18 acetylase RimI-like enzyme
MDSPALREASPAEAERLLAIEQTAFAPYRALLDPPSSVFRETPDVIRQKMGEGAFLVACEGDQIIGMVFLQPHADHVYLGRLSVLPAWQGRGVARALIAAVEGRARALGAPAIRLAVRVALPQLIATYARQGFQVISEHRHPGYAHTTFVTMEKRLTD